MFQLLNNLAEVLQKQVRVKLSPCTHVAYMCGAYIRQKSGNTVPRLNLLPQGKYDEAEPLYRRAMAIAEAALDTDHASYSTLTWATSRDCYRRR